LVELYGLTLTREQLLARVGDISQVGGVRLAELADGPERGVRIADFRTGTGLHFTVHIDRGLDIGLLEYGGEPLSWRSSAGVVAPAYYRPEGTGWIHGFPGGALTTCGLTHAGAACTDEGEELGLHGPASYIPAQNVVADGIWQGDTYEMFVQGRVREASLFGHKIELVRRIWTRLGEDRFFVRDRVTNIGGTQAPHMILYHCNFGYPLLDEETELISPSREVLPRDDVARAGLAEYNRFGPPQPGYQEQVFYHEMEEDDSGLVWVALVNHRASVGRGLGVYLRYRKRDLPRFIEWKMLGYGDYVVGLEPANCWVEGRAVERARGTLQFLEPGETREYMLEMGVLPDNGAIERLEEDMQAEHPEWEQRREL
jgi:hypothetical protein